MKENLIDIIGIEKLIGSLRDFIKSYAERLKSLRENLCCRK
jgi:hypothetical protein